MENPQNRLIIIENRCYGNRGLLLKIICLIWGYPGIDISGFSQGLPAAFNPFVAQPRGFIMPGDHLLPDNSESNIILFIKNTWSSHIQNLLKPPITRISWNNFMLGNTTSGKRSYLFYNTYIDKIEDN